MMSVMKRVVVCLTLIFVCAVGKSDVPKMISHQGKIAVGGSNFTGTGLFKFALVNSGGSFIWSNSSDTDGDGMPDESVSLTVTDGLYSILLGDSSITGMQEIPYSVFTNEVVSLRVWFNDSTHGWQRLQPDQRVAPSGYALQAAELNGKVNTSSGTLTVSDMVGIGSTSPLYPLDVYTSSATETYFHRLQGDSNQVYNIVTLNSRNKTGDRNYLKFHHGDTLNSQIFTDYDASSASSVLYVTNNTQSSINFRTNGSNDRMIITGAGRVGIGTTSPATLLDVDGSITANNYITDSDARLKKDIEPIDDASSRIESLRGVSFRWRGKDSEDGEEVKTLGFIAQDVEKVIPNVVKTSQSGMKGISYSQITPVLVEAFKEQQAIIKAQKKELEELRTRLERMERYLPQNTQSK